MYSAEMGPSEKIRMKSCNSVGFPGVHTVKAPKLPLPCNLIRNKVFTPAVLPSTGVC